VSKLLTSKKVKRLIAALAIVAVAVVMAGCSISSTPVSHTSGNWWERYVVYYVSRFLLWIGSLLHNDYGWTIIVFTILVRIILLPLNVISTKSMTKTQQLQPELDALRKKYPGKDAESQQKLTEETQKLYKENGVNPYAGCLPLLLQLPIMYALYEAIYRTPQLMNGHFFWMNLGRPDQYYVMPILAAVFTFMSSYISQMSTPKSARNGSTQAMLYIMPIFIGVTAAGIQSAISLYWVISNLFQVVQTFFLQNPFKYQREVAEKEKAEQERQRQIRKAYKQIKRRRKH
jgi:YidC/Oxa1 family membrane protein insertase